jgi:Tol biopolymer transport system component
MAQITTIETATSPTWSPDGSWIAFGAAKEEIFAIYGVEVDSQRVRELHTSDYPLSPAGFLRGGDALVFIERSPRSDVFALTLDESISAPSIVPVLETDEVEESAALSSDGRLLVYESERAGRRQIFVRDLENNRDVQVSPRGGMEPVWAKDGRTVLFRDSGDWSLAAASVVVDPQLRVAGQETLFPSGQYWLGFIEPAYDTRADGRLLMVRHREPGGPRDRLHVVVNFTGRLRR